MVIKENQGLAPFTTFGIGGPARWFAEATSEAEIAEAVAWARDRGLALFVLGGGSNLLVADAGFDGFVLHVGIKGIEQQGEQFRLGAGEDWDGFVSLAVERGFAGVECLAGIPGTVGGHRCRMLARTGKRSTRSLNGCGRLILRRESLSSWLMANVVFVPPQPLQFDRSRAFHRDAGRLSIAARRYADD